MRSPRPRWPGCRCTKIGCGASSRTWISSPRALGLAEPKKQRLANRFFALAKDNALRCGAGLDLARFASAETKWALAADERRYTVPNPVAGQPGEPPLRSCIAKEGSCEGVYEVPRQRLGYGRDFRPTIHCTQDEGSIGFPCMIWEMQHLGLRASFTEDEWHRIMDDLGDAAREAGVWTLILEWGCVANFRTDPWKGASFLQKLRGCCEAYYRDASPDDELFIALYDRIADDFGMSRDAHYGSATHRAEVWQKCSSWYSCQEQLRDGRHTLLLGLVLVGLDKGWWASLAQLPLLQVTSLQDRDGAAAEDLGEPASDEPAQRREAEELVRQTVAASNAQVNKVKSACQNQMHFAAMVLANPFKAQLVDILVECSKPLRVDFWTGIERAMTKVGALHRDIDLATGKYTQVFINTLHVWSDPGVLLKLGFIIDSTGDKVDSEQMEVERKLCSYWAAWCSRTVCTRSGSLATWTSAYPHGFVGLISDDAGIRANNMAKAQRDLNLLMGLEAAALNDPRAKDVLAQLMWPQDVFTRETFIDLVEIDWQLPLSESLSARLKAFGFANKRTKIQEDLFKVCRKRASLSDAGFCSRRGRWDTAVRSSLIGDYDRTPLQPT